MPPQVTVDAAKTALPLQAHGILPLFLSSLWVGIQTATGLFGRRAPSAPKAAPATIRPASTPPSIDRGHRLVSRYLETLKKAWEAHDWSDVALLIETLRHCWRENRQVFLCGNGGSAANAIHLANDLLYGIAKDTGHGLRVIALPANSAVLTCLANDIAYEDIFAQQLTALAQPGDVLITFSGSGNSPNILKALRRARELGVTSFAVLGFNGGAALALADHPIHFAVDDMQVSEDLQMMVGHIAMQSLAASGR